MTKKRKINKLNTYSIIISIILGVLTLLNIYSVIKINVFPFKYLILFFIIFILSIVLIVFNFKLNKKKKKTRITLCCASTILSLIFLVMFIYFNKTFGFLNKIMSKNYKTENYIVVVNKNSNYNKINELKGKKISYVKTDIYNIDKALETLDKTITYTKAQKDDYELLLQELYDNKTDAIIMEESYKELLVSEASATKSLYTTFDEKTKVIYSFEVKIENKNDDIEKDVNVSEEPFNVYISGMDTYGKISSISRSDVNIIASVNPKTKQVLLTTIPRDYYVQLDGTTGYKDKLTHAGIYGIDKSQKTIQNLLGIDINYYVKVNFTSLIKMVGAVGGVNVYSKYSFSGEKYTFKQGYNKMNGEQALEFSRTRKTLSGGDRARGENQEAVIAALISKICSKAIITNYVSILDSLEDTFITNMDQSKITELIKMQLDDMAKWNVTSISLDGTNASEYTYSYQHQKLYVMIPTQSTIDNAKQKIKALFSGESLESSYKEDNGNAATVSTKTTTSTIKQETTKQETAKTNETKTSVTTEKNQNTEAKTEIDTEEIKNEQTLKDEKQSTTEKQEDSSSACSTENNNCSENTSN